MMTGISFSTEGNRCPELLRSSNIIFMEEGLDGGSVSGVESETCGVT